MKSITGFTNALSSHLPETHAILAAGNLVVHDGVEAITLHGSRGPSGGARVDSDIDLALVVGPALLAEATSLGAAIAGGVGVGLYSDFSVAHQFVQVEEAEQPNPDYQSRYAALYNLFQQSYTALEPVFEQLGALGE